jgi:hypothetical protein
VPSARDSGCDAGKNSEQNDADLGVNGNFSEQSMRHFMCRDSGSRSRISVEVDPLPSVPVTGIESPSGSAGACASGASSGSVDQTPGSSAPIPPSPPSSVRVAAQTDPIAEGTSISSVSPSITEITPFGSSAGELDVPQLAPEPSTRPVTRLQRGIHQPKRYTDGTV